MMKKEISKKKSAVALAATRNPKEKELNTYDAQGRNLESLTFIGKDIMERLYRRIGC